MPEDRLVVLAIRVPVRLRVRLEEAAELHGFSLSAWSARLLELALVEGDGDAG